MTNDGRVAQPRTPRDASTKLDFQPPEPVWKQRAVARSINAARSRAELRAQKFIDAAFSLMDENASIEFTIQEVIDRSEQSLRGFYQCFEGKDELLLALFEESVREALDDIRDAVEATSVPLERLHAFVLRLHEWCEPADTPRKRGQHNRRPISEFTLQLAVNHPERVADMMAPLQRFVATLVEEAAAAGTIRTADPRRTAALVMQTVFFSWFTNRSPAKRSRGTAEQTWEFCLHGLAGG